MNRSFEAASKRPMRTLAVLALVALSLTAALPAAALERNARAPEIGLRDGAGHPVRMADLRGKVVLVDFWASWCAPCRQELPVLERLYARYRDRGFVVVGVNVDRERANMAEFVRRFRLTFPVVHDGEHRVADRYGPRTMPSSYLVDRGGVVRYVHQGFRASDADVIEEHVQELLGSNARASRR